ncbi:hypothetical protein HOI18_01730 [Candidatus Uhrbacteria bacterium]|jgi:hypothetical protein|nr:hypothetical protein [Candidatus Uhrbacteria bacterium]
MVFREGSAEISFEKEVAYNVEAAWRLMKGDGYSASYAAGLALDGQAEGRQKQRLYRAVIKGLANKGSKERAKLKAEQTKKTEERAAYDKFVDEDRQKQLLKGAYEHEARIDPRERDDEE